MAVQKKKFFEVSVPLTGETTSVYAFDMDSLAGRNLKLDLTRIFRGKGVEASFNISVSEGVATARPRMMRLLPYFIRRIIRKRTSYVEDSFVVSSSDGLLRIKPFLITRKMVSRAVRNALRVATQAFLSEYCSDKPTDEIFSDVTQGKLQKVLLIKLKKVYPLALCEIRHIEVEKKKE
jgi:ribosomal protein S3AE